jgi:FkbM family methyltransferase
MIPTANSAIGRAIRLPLRLIPPTAVFPVLSGINRGLAWRVSASNHGCWIGTYERAKQRLIRDLVKPGMLVFDVGANAGFYSIACARMGARVIAFEPVTENLEFLRFHIQRNRLHVDVQTVAVADRIGEARFRLGRSLSMGGLDARGDTTVPTITLDSLGMTPDLVKIDIEGGEYDALVGAQRLIAERRTIWLVALDDRAKRGACLSLLKGYRIQEFAPDEIVATPT